MRLFVSDLGNWGIINEEVFGFAIVNCDKWEEEDFNYLDSVEDSHKPINAIAVQKNIERDNGTPRSSWLDIPKHLEELEELADKLGVIRLRSLAVEIREAVGL